MDARQLIDQIADLVIAKDPQALAGRVLELCLALSNGRQGAIFSREQGRVLLFASRHLDQPVLEAVHTVWETHSSSLLTGQAFVATAQQGPLFQAALKGLESLAIVPLMEPSKGLGGLLYLDSAKPGFWTAEDLATVSSFSRLAVMAIASAAQPTIEGAVERYLERTPSDEIVREQLLLLLDRHEWNLARVARVLGVSRRTIYLRLERFNIERRRIPKGNRAVLRRA